MMNQTTFMMNQTIIYNFRFKNIGPINIELKI